MPKVVYDGEEKGACYGNGGADWWDYQTGVGRVRYELNGIDRVDVDGTVLTVADIANLNDILPAFEGIEAVVHLGADPSPQASWESVLSSNIVGTRNVYEAARLSGV